MKNIKDLNERLLFEATEKEKDRKDDKKESTLKAKEFRDTLQVYVGRVTGSSKIEIKYKELKKELEEKVKGVNWTINNVKKVFEIITKKVGVQPEDDRE